jgi:peptidoglycan/xylan/chitin deacetylase (PgdA/CDA1 family)
MSRFHTVFLLSIAAIIAAAFMLNGWARILAIGAIVILNMTLFGIGMAFIRTQYFARVICSAKPGRNRVALTFDDGPDAASTPAVLDLLARENIPAAFFCIGRQVETHPELARRIVGEGHLIENHSHHHAYTLMFNRAGGLTKEFGQSQRAIEQAAGVSPRFLRPPVGLTNPHFSKMCRNLGLTIVGWDVRPLDTIRSADEVVEYVLKTAKDGSIILLHDARTSPERITDIVQRIVNGLRAKGLGFDRLDRLLEP